MFKDKNELLNYINKELKKYDGKLLLLTKSGSKLYGTDTPESDEDYMGVFIAGPKFHLGFQKVEEVDLSIKDKLENGKNSKDAIDIKIYELKKFLKLCGEVNPNIVELLYCHTNKNAIIYNTKEFQIFQNNPELFINKRVFHSFLGYAKSQLKKGTVKAVNYKNLYEFKNTLEKFLQTHEGSMTLGEIQHYNEFAPFKHLFKKDGLVVSNLTFPRNYFIKKVLKMINEKLKMASHRSEQWEKYGYDTKFFSHLFRLLEEGENLIKYKKLKFPLKNVKYLKEVRSGKFTLQELEDKMNKGFKHFNSLENFVEKNLPKTANWKKIENLYMNLMLNYISNFKTKLSQVNSFNI